MLRQHISSGSPWETITGYSRAVRAGHLIFVSATAATAQDGRVLYPGDAYQQTRAILARIEAALREAGSSLNDIVQTRLYLRDITCWEEAGRAHGEIFREIRPATSMVEVNRFLDPNMLVEIEAIAVLSEPAGEDNLC